MKHLKTYVTTIDALIKNFNPNNVNYQKMKISNYHVFSLLAGFALLFSSCQKEGLQSNTQKLDLLTTTEKQALKKHSSGPIQINFTEHNLFPEGVAYDPHNDWFYVSSAAHGTVGIVTFDY